ncbi:glycosyltransferase [Ornithinibacillus contaminans]|uniref:glycosyltransferase n=1 Tax=Ornithinibacillus contaminans TaxID=694055 RepID=UPI00064DEB13|nr:glycosyltransferase [Ornithinibacillus contaminans]
MADATISLCMVVKNEESSIERCLKSVRDLVDEIIIVDTGSSDNTLSICKQYTNHIHLVDWENDFAKARNYSLQFATGDWIVWLDADEEFDRTTFEDLKSVLQHKKETFLYVPVRNYIGDTISEHDVYTIFQARIFQNNKGITFQNKIHEQIHIPVEDFQYAILPSLIKHYGYLNAEIETKNKHERNLDILKLELESEGHSPWIDYHVASEYYNAKDYEKAFHFVNYAILKFVEEGVLPPAIVYRLKYSIIVESENYQGAWPSINKAIELYPDYVDLYYLKATVLFHLGKYQEAVEVLDHCLLLGEENHNYLILKGTGSFRAVDLKEKCLQKLQ